MWPLLRKLLFLLPPELTHDLAKLFLKVVYRISLIKRTYSVRDSLNPVLPGIGQAINPIGLAAGFDKNADILEALAHFGFGSAEIGTVTPKPQGGNDRPRLFRIPSDQNIFNRMGFNNLGAGIVSDRVRKVKPSLPSAFKVGVNLGKNKTTPDHEAASDYAKVANAFIDCADYFVINVSSPNTPGLRALQTPEFLLPIVKAVQDVVSKNSKTIPIWVKLAPEITGEALQTIISALESVKIDGLVLTNTLGGTHIYREKEFQGGYSGRILTDLSYERLVEARSMTQLPIISVGGVSSGEEVKRRLTAGAQWVQIYSGWIYGGPFLVRRIVRALNR